LGTGGFGIKGMPRGVSGNPFEIVNITSKAKASTDSVCLQTQNEHKYMKTYIMMAEGCA